MKSGCWSVAVRPPRIFGNVFSDLIYEELSPGEYTRDDVLARAKVCGDILSFHGKSYIDDSEIMEAALESSFLHKLPLLHIGAWRYDCRSELQKNKQFMIKAVLKNRFNLKYASPANADDPDVYAAAQTQECKQALHKVPRTNLASNGPQPQWQFDNIFNHFHPDPVEAAYILAYCPSNTKVYKRVFIDNDTLLDIIARDASVLETIVKRASMKAVKQNRVWETAADELINDKQFMLNCVRRNRHTVFQVAASLPHLVNDVKAAFLQALDRPSGRRCTLLQSVLFERLVNVIFVDHGSVCSCLLCPQHITNQPTQSIV